MSRRPRWPFLVIAIVCCALGCRTSESTRQPVRTPGPVCLGTVVNGNCIDEQPPDDVFFGEVNGFIFGNRTTPAGSDMSPKCTTTLLGGNNVRYADEWEIEASAINFEPTYLPPGAQVHVVAASACADDVFIVAKEYVVPGVGILRIARRKGPAEFRAQHDLTSLQAGTYGGRPTLQAGQVMYIRDPLSSWELSVMGIDLNLLPLVAEGLKDSHP